MPGAIGLFLYGYPRINMDIIPPNTILNNTYSYMTSVDMQDCPICYTIMAKGDKISVSPCDHTFHYDCMKRWIQTVSQRHTSYREGCPMCRGNLEIKHKYHDIAEQVAKRKEEVEREKLDAIRKKEKEQQELDAFRKIFSENHKSRRENKYNKAINSQTNKNVHKQSKQGRR